MSALHLTSLRIRGFRNLSAVDVEPHPRFNVLAGPNGAGKSNVLEAVYYVASLRSFRGALLDDLVERGGAEAELAAELAGDGPARRFRIRLRRAGGERTAGRYVSVDGKRPRSHSTYHASIHAVVFSPADVALGGGSPAGRRAFLDAILEQIDPSFEATSRDYGRALRARNRLLRDASLDTKQLGVFDRVLAPLGARIGRARAELCERLGPRAASAFTRISGPAPSFAMGYRPRVEPDAERLLRALGASHDKDRARGFTSDGPHTDELEVAIDGRVARGFASQGQQRAVALALKTAELEELRRRTGMAPLLLLDDVSSELDRERSARLFEHLAALGGQVFLTTTHASYIALEGERADFEVLGGEVRATC